LTIASSASAASLLARQQYAPGTLATLTTSSGSLVAIDTTNLTVSFTAPASGAVLVRLSGAIKGASGATVPSGVVWGLCVHSTTTPAGDSAMVPVTSTFLASTAQADILITGLTPSTVYQYDWAWAAPGANPNLLAQAVSTSGAQSTAQGSPAVMEVWSA
jgi:hypothetical protein